PDRGTLSRVGQRLGTIRKKGWSTEKTSGKWVSSSPSSPSRERAKPKSHQNNQDPYLRGEHYTRESGDTQKNQRERERVGNWFKAALAEDKQTETMENERTSFPPILASPVACGLPEPNAQVTVIACELDSVDMWENPPPAADVFPCTMWQVCAVGRCPFASILTLHSGFQALLGEEISGD
ncbi:hypothetical protein PspLS_04563, partial [Pyricularia sp. CBS 133598]